VGAPLSLRGGTETGVASDEREVKMRGGEGQGIGATNGDAGTAVDHVAGSFFLRGEYRMVATCLILVRSVSLSSSIRGEGKKRG
jgi:hypothetical protein